MRYTERERGADKRRSCAIILRAAAPSRAHPFSPVSRAHLIARRRCNALWASSGKTKCGKFDFFLFSFFRSSSPALTIFARACVCGGVLACLCGTGAHTSHGAAEGSPLRADGDKGEGSVRTTAREKCKVSLPPSHRHHNCSRRLLIKIDWRSSNSVVLHHRAAPVPVLGLPRSVAHARQSACARTRGCFNVPVNMRRHSRK